MFPGTMLAATTATWARCTRLPLSRLPRPPSSSPGWFIVFTDVHVRHFCEHVVLVIAQGRLIAILVFLIGRHGLEK